MYAKFEEGKQYAEYVSADGDDFQVIWTCVKVTKSFATFHFQKGVNQETIRAKIRNYGSCEWAYTRGLDILARDIVEVQ